MRDETFWLLIWTIISMLIAGVIWISADYWKDHNEKITALIRDGVDPVAAMCAMQDDYGNHPTCIILATKQKTP